MPKTAKSLDHEILAAFDTGWCDHPAGLIAEEELDRIIGLFGAPDDQTEARLRDPVRRIFRSFVTLSAIERGNMDNDRIIRPSTAALRELREIGERIEALDSALSSLQQVTSAAIDADLETRGVIASDRNHLRCQELLNLTSAALDQWHGVVRVGELSAGKGPNNGGARKMVQAMANWWEEVHAARPKTDRGRGLQPDPFLDLCQEIVRIARPRLQQLGVDLGTTNLSGIVDDVLKNSGQGRS